MLAHFNRIAEGKLSSIEIGGLVTRIASNVVPNWDDLNLEPLVRYEPVLDWDDLSGKNRWLDGDFEGTVPVRWFLKPREWILLPSDQLPPIEPLPRGSQALGVSYLIPPWLIYHRLADGSVATLQDPPVAEGGAPTYDAGVGSGGFQSPYGYVPEMGQSSSYGAPQMGQFGEMGAPERGPSSFVPVDYANPGYSYVAPPRYYEHHNPMWRDSRDNHFYAESRLHYAAQYQMGVHAGALPTTGTLPNYYTGPDGQAGYFPDHILGQHGIDPSTYNRDYHVTYGGWDGQYLGFPHHPPAPPPPSGDDTMDDQ